MPVRIWGTADAGETVKVDFQGQSVCDEGARKRQVGGVAEAAGGRRAAGDDDQRLHHQGRAGGRGVARLRPIEHGVPAANAVNHDEEIARADYPMIHLFQVKKLVAEQPAEDVVGTWQVCSPASVKSFSAVEYFFGRHLQQKLHVPMGLIESDWGGTPAQSWTRKEAMRPIRR